MRDDADRIDAILGMQETPDILFSPWFKLHAFPATCCSIEGLNAGVQQWASYGIVCSLLSRIDELDKRAPLSQRLEAWRSYLVRHGSRRYTSELLAAAVFSPAVGRDMAVRVLYKDPQSFSVN